MLKIGQSWGKLQIIPPKNRHPYLHAFLTFYKVMAAVTESLVRMD